MTRLQPGPWIAIAMGIAGVACLLFAPRASAEPQPPRLWAIEKCTDSGCGLLAWRYSGPTACAVDAQSERMGREQPSGVTLVCIRVVETKR